MKKTINLDGVDPILFVGLNDQNIKVLESHYDSKIVVRGSSMKVEGEKEEITITTGSGWRCRSSHRGPLSDTYLTPI